MKEEEITTIVSPVPKLSEKEKEQYEKEGVIYDFAFQEGIQSKLKEVLEKIDRFEKEHSVIFSDNRNSDLRINWEDWGKLKKELSEVNHSLNLSGEKLQDFGAEKQGEASSYSLSSSRPECSKELPGVKE